MMTWQRKHTFIAGLSLILLTNAVALLGVAYNRSGTPESRLTLSQRELQLPYGAMTEDSGLTLWIRWRAQNAGDYGPPAWLDEKKLRELGFDLPAINQDYGYSRRLHEQERPAFIVLELDGPAFRQGIAMARERVAREKAILAAMPDNQEFKQRLQYAENNLSQEEKESSRLIAIDAGLDALSLRARYPDSTHYLILPGSIQPSYQGRSGKTEWAGFLHRVTGDSVHVPLEHRRHLKQMPYSGRTTFEADVAFGKRSEPWLESVRWEGVAASEK
jgi:hypothetical protein